LQKKTGNHRAVRTLHLVGTPKWPAAAAGRKNVVQFSVFDGEKPPAPAIPI